MGKWKEVELKEVIEVINGRAYKKAELLENGKYPVLRVGNLFTNDSWYYSDLELKEDKYCDYGDLIYAWSASFGPRIWNGKRVIYHYHIWKMICDEKVLNKQFAFQFLDWDKDLMKQEHSRGVGMFHLTKTAIENRKFLLPPLKEQKQIVAKLDGLFEKIDQALSLLEENIKHTQTLMGSVLDEEFGKLEKKYDTKPLAKIVKVINGRAYKKQEMLDSGKYPILRVGNFFSNRGWYYSNMELNEDKYCVKGDLLYAWSASFGPKIWDGEKSIYHYHIWKLVPLNSVVSRKYLYYLLERDTEKIKEEGGRGVGMIHITKGGIEKRMMVLPPLDIQNKLVEFLEDSYSINNKLLKSQTQKLNYLKALKNSLLDQAFKGEL